MILSALRNFIGTAFTRNGVGAIDGIKLRTALLEITNRLEQNFKGAWAANTSYLTGDQVTLGGNTYRRKADGVSVQTFNPGEWDMTAQGGTVTDGSVTAPKVASQAITGEKLRIKGIGHSRTSFLRPAGRSLFNPRDPENKPGHYITDAGAEVASADFTISHYIEVTAGETYNVTQSQFIAFFDQNLTVLPGLNFDHPRVFTIPAGVVYLRLSIPSSQISTFQIQPGSTITGEPFAVLYTGKSVDGGQALLNVQMTAAELRNLSKFFSISEQLYNRADPGNIVGRYITDTGVQVVDPVYTISSFIPVKPGRSYIVSNIQFACFFADDKQTVVLPGLSFDRLSPIFVPPDGAAYVRLTVGGADKENFMVHEGTSLKPYQKYGATVSGELNANQPLFGKTVWVGGTSIPALGGYVELATQTLGGTAINKAVGSSTIRKADKNGSWAGVPWQNVAYCLSMTLAEKQDLIDNWATYRSQFSFSPPLTLTSADKAFFRACSYEASLVPYLNGSLPMPDFFYFSHGYNDVFAGETAGEFAAVPSVRNDRNTFIGAQNYIIDVILAYNPRARIFFEGHYENQLNPRVATGQQTLANYWQFPLNRVWEESGFSQQLIPGSQPLWNQGPYSAFNIGQNTSLDMTALRYWTVDGVHVHTDPSGRIRERMASIVENFLRRNV